jgi:hypothetical protein
VRVRRWEHAESCPLTFAKFEAQHPHPLVTALAKRIASAAPIDLSRFAGEVILRAVIFRSCLPSAARSLRGAIRLKLLRGYAER